MSRILKKLQPGGLQVNVQSVGWLLRRWVEGKLNGRSRLLELSRLISMLLGVRNPYGWVWAGYVRILPVCSKLLEAWEKAFVTLLLLLRRMQFGTP